MEIAFYAGYNFLSPKPRDINSYKKACASLGVPYDPEGVKSTIQKVAVELNLDGKLDRILIDGEESESWVELIGGSKGRTCVYHLNPSLASENEVRHELMHIYDILNPEFKFDSVLQDKISEDAMLIEIVDELWNVNIDARLEGRGINREERFKIFSEIMQSKLDLTERELNELFQEHFIKTIIPFEKLVKRAMELRGYLNERAANGC
jgi:hypothetical protein